MSDIHMLLLLSSKNINNFFLSIILFLFDNILVILMTLHGNQPKEENEVYLKGLFKYSLEFLVLRIMKYLCIYFYI
jgi:hypothetical protein